MARDHQPVVIEDFNGLWQRGNREAVPRDHFTECNNIDFYEGGVCTRPGADTYRGVANVLRMYNYTTQDGPTIIYLTSDGKIWHSTSPINTYGPILTIVGMIDFAFTAIAGRAFISPHNGVKGLEDEFVYIYNGDGTPARKAVGSKPISTPTLTNTGAGFVEEGRHVIGVAYETNTGAITGISPLAVIDAPGGQNITVADIPVSPDNYVVARRIVASKLIQDDDWTGNLEGYQLYFVSTGRINNNVDTSLEISFFDADLLEDAWYTLDLLEEIPAGVGLNVYHERLVSWGEFDNISLIRVSRPGEPEAMDAISGMIVFPLDGEPVTFAQEFRDILYAFKETKTKAWTDNGGDPSSWPMSNVDEGMGCLVHGMATVLDSSGQTIEYLMISNFTGICLFNGTFMEPELSWKIENLWKLLSRVELRAGQLLNDSIDKKIYINLPQHRILYGNYSEGGLDPKEIKWTPWTFNFRTSTICLTEKNRLIIGSSESVVP